MLSGHETPEPAESGPAPVQHGFDHISTFKFDLDGDGELDTGIGSVTDVWEHEGFAYVGTLYEPNCSRFGTRIVDIRNPAAPEYVGNLESMPNTRVNDVKVTSIDSRWFSGDLLAATQEPCFLSRGDGTLMENKGGRRADPARPHRPGEPRVPRRQRLRPRVFEDPPLPGDHTMHNIVMGPTGTDWEDTAFVSWYSDGMIALDASDPTALDWTGQWIGCYGQDGCDPTVTDPLQGGLQPGGGAIP